MMRDIFKQMIPFILLMAVLWLMAEFLERMFEEQTGPRLLQPPVTTSSPNPDPAAP